MLELQRFITLTLHQPLTSLYKAVCSFWLWQIKSVHLFSSRGRSDARRGQSRYGYRPAHVRRASGWYSWWRERERNFIRNFIRAQMEVRCSSSLSWSAYAGQPNENSIRPVSWLLDHVTDHFFCLWPHILTVRLRFFSIYCPLVGKMLLFFIFQMLVRYPVSSTELQSWSQDLISQHSVPISVLDGFIWNRQIQISCALRRTYVHDSLINKIFQRNC